MSILRGHQPRNGVKSLNILLRLRVSLMRHYWFTLLLLFSIFLGALLGVMWGDSTTVLKPLGDLFLHLIYTTVVPLVFFSVATAIAKAGKAGQLKRLFSITFQVFVLTSSIAAVYMLCVVRLFPPAQTLSLSTIGMNQAPSTSILAQLVSMFTVPELSVLLSHEHMLALIVFSMLVGVATAQVGENGEAFLAFLQAGERIFMRVFDIIMYYAPIGFCAYFAVLVHDIGSKLMTSYMQVTLVYYIAGFFYFVFGCTFYAYLAGRLPAIKQFWQHIFVPATTAIATCSSAASIPANLLATQQMGVPSAVAETVVPLGAMLHKDGSVLGGVLKIAFLFSVFHMSFAGLSVMCLAFAVSLLVGTVMGAIPSGGMLGELLILALYGFPPQALIVIAAISIIIDPLATMISVTTNTVSAQLIAKWVKRKN